MVTVEALAPLKHDWAVLRTATHVAAQLPVFHALTLLRVFQAAALVIADFEVLVEPVFIVVLKVFEHGSIVVFLSIQKLGGETGIVLHCFFLVLAAHGRHLGNCFAIPQNLFATDELIRISFVLEQCQDKA